MFWIFVIIVVILTIIMGINENKQKYNYENDLMSEEQKEKYERKLKQREINKQNYQNMRQNSINKTKIVKTKILTNTIDSRKKVGSTVIRGAVGGSLLGPVGMLGGAMSGKNKTTNKVTFIIEYADGHRETKTVENESNEFKKLCNYLEM